MQLARPERRHAPIVIEANEVERVDALARAEKLRQLAGEAEIPPVRAEQRCGDRNALAKREQRMKPRRSRRIQPPLARNHHELDAVGIAEDELRDSPRNLGLKPRVTLRSLCVTLSLSKGAQPRHARVNADSQLTALSNARDRAVHIGDGLL